VRSARRRRRGSPSRRRPGAALLAAVPIARALLRAGAAGALLGLLGLVAPTAAWAAAKPCVAVVVDGRLAGGPLHTACATGDPRSGLLALTDAGISYAFVPRQPGQVCQLDGLPECSRNSADTYWSYWWRAKGSHRWVYATEGAGSHDPAPGDTEGWVWQEGGRRPPPDIAFGTICPQAALPAATATPTRSAARSSTGASSRPSPEIPATPSRSPESVTTPLPSDDASMRAAPVAPPSASTPTSASEISTPTSTPSAPTPESSTPAAAVGPDDGGSPPWAGLAVGAGAIALLGGAAVTRFRRTAGSS
jgi:hypothetical protein